MDANKTQGEPPPIQCNDNDKFYESVISHVYDSINDFNCKPTTINLVLENHHPQSELCASIQSSIDTHPVKLLDSTHSPILPSTNQKKYTTSPMDVDLVGELVNTTDDINAIPDDDPVITSLQTAQDTINKSWIPSLNNIIEETEYDIRIENDIPFIKQTSHVSAKRHRGRKHTQIKLQHQYEQKNSFSHFQQRYILHYTQYCSK